MGGTLVNNGAGPAAGATPRSRWCWRPGRCWSGRRAACWLSLQRWN